jgi:flavin reductase
MTSVERAPGITGLAPDGREFRSTMGLFATGITVVTASSGSPHGMTANAFTSVSIDPPLVLVCVGREAVMHQHILAAGTFGVSVLGAGQEGVARYFADRRRPLGQAQFDAVDWVPGPLTSAPLLGGSMAWMECALRDAHPAGDHSIFIGEVMDLSRGDAGDALLFYRGAFRQLESDR